MKTEKPLKEGYTLVTDLQKGDCIVNLGIIKHIFPHPAKGEIQIIFDPSREHIKRSYWYKNTVALKIA